MGLQVTLYFLDSIYHLRQMCTAQLKGLRQTMLLTSL